MTIGTIQYPAGTFGFKFKNTDETIQSDIVESLDSELFINVEAGKSYCCLLMLRVNSGTTPDFQYHFGGTATLDAGSFFYDELFSSGGVLACLAIGSALGVVGLGASGMLPVFCFIPVTASGTFGIMWSQETSDASDTTVEEGSWLVAWESK